MTRRTRVAWTVAAAVLAVTLALPALAAAPRKEPTADEIAKMKAACETLKPQVQPKTPRKLLVFSVSHGYFHTAIPYGQKAIPILGEATGAFEATVSDDLAMFEPERLKAFDAVFFNSANRDVFRPEDFDTLPAEEKQKALDRDARLKESFRAWLASGHGLAVIHAGVAALREWPEYGNIIGARFQNHPWGAGSKVGMKVEEPDHPLCRALGEPRFTIVDEVYQLADPYSRDLCRVLVSIDAERSDMTKKTIVRTDGDFAMTYIKPYEKGRVYYNAWGHMHELFWNPMVLGHWLDGIQYALGDLDADSTPSARK